MQQIQLYCTDKNKYLDADILQMKQFGFIKTVLVGTDMTITLKYDPKKNIYIGSKAGFEFIYNPEQEQHG